MTSLFSPAETSYTLAGLLSTPPARSDGRALAEYRPLRVARAVSQQANGSARVTGAGCDWLVGIRAEVGPGEGGLEVGVEYSPIAQNSPTLPPIPPATLSHLLLTLLSPLLPLQQFTILPPTPSAPTPKSYTLHLTALLLSSPSASPSTLLDTLFLAARTSLRDTRLPRTRALAYEAGEKEKASGEKGELDRFGLKTKGGGGRGTQGAPGAVDFELEDYWDEGKELEGREELPVCVTLNVVGPTHYLDATPLESLASPSTSSALSLLFSPSGTLRGTHTWGEGEVEFSRLPSLIAHGRRYAQDLMKGVDQQLAVQDKVAHDAPASKGYFES